ncbi:MAG: hypothetical protein WC758_02335 [Candidatus Woesearchaeota archaeon]|jgi:hypothetical protein
MKYPKTVEEDLQSITEEELLKEKKTLSKKTKRALILVSGLVMIFLMLSFIYIQFPISNIIAGQIESNALNNNLLNVDNLTIFFEDNALNTIKTSYANNPKVETSLCLIGTNISTSYTITSAYTPKIYSQTFNEVIFESCNSNTIIMFHTHPYKSCIASTTDLETLKKNKLTNPKLLMLIMCEPDRFSTYY